MAEITASKAGGVNVVAFLDMLAWSEGTDNGKQATKDRGYDVIVGGQLFKSYADHPRVLVDLPKLKIQSSAAGRYQLLRRYHDAYKKTLGLKDFSPLSQDLIALQQIAAVWCVGFARRLGIHERNYEPPRMSFHQRRCGGQHRVHAGPEWRDV